MFHTNVHAVATTFPQVSTNGGLMLGAMAIVAALLALLTLTTTTVTTAPPPPSQQKMVAIVDDDDTWQNIWSDVTTDALVLAGGGTPTIFPNCESLLVTMQAGQRFDLYIVDNDLGRGFMRGPVCVQRIRALHPTAKIVGNRAAANDPGFMANGANLFVDKGTVVIKKITEVIVNLLK